MKQVLLSIANQLEMQVLSRLCKVQEVNQSSRLCKVWEVNQSSRPYKVLGSSSPAAELLSSNAQLAYLWRFGIRFFWSSICLYLQDSPSKQ
jgi:hypothetical protein